MCTCVSLSVCASTLISLLYSSQDCFLPSLKWVVGAFQHLSTTEKDEEEEEEEGEAEQEEDGGVTFCSKTGRNWGVLTQRHAHEVTLSDT